MLMRYLLKGFLLIVCYLLLPFAGAAQVTVSLPTVTAKKADFINIPIRVKGFKEIVTLQFSLKWDETVLKPVSINDLNLPSLRPDNFGTKPSRISFGWLDESLKGQTVPDGTTIFTVRFEVIGALDATTNIEFFNQPTIIEATGLKSSTLKVYTENGTLKVGQITATRDNLITEQILVLTTPNPFADWTTLHFSMQSREHVTLRVFDALGALILHTSDFFPEGPQEFRITCDQLPVAGVYYYQIATDSRARARGKFVFFKH
jgi:Cohesin domain